MRILTIDIGGTFIKHAVMDETMEILAGSKGKIPTPMDSRDSLVETIIGLYDLYDTAGDIKGIAISVPGVIDSEHGYCVTGGALHYNNGFYLGQALEDRCHVPVWLENDAKCAAMAEATAGSLKDVADGFVLIFGTGIGGAFIKDHKLHWGKHFAAGEVSHMITIQDAFPSRESIWGVRCGVARLCQMFAQRKSLPQDSVDGVQVFEAVNSGDTDGLNVLDEFAHDIAIQMFNIQAILDPERFAIGGGISAQPGRQHLLFRQEA